MARERLRNLYKKKITNAIGSQIKRIMNTSGNTNENFQPQPMMTNFQQRNMKTRPRYKQEEKQTSLSSLFNFLSGDLLFIVLLLYCIIIIGYRLTFSLFILLLLQPINKINKYNDRITDPRQKISFLI